MSGLVFMVRVEHLYEHGHVETFEGTGQATRALLLLRYAPLLRREDAADVHDVIAQLSDLQILSVTVSFGVPFDAQRRRA